MTLIAYWLSLIAQGLNGVLDFRHWQAFLS